MESNTKISPSQLLSPLSNQQIFTCGKCEYLLTSEGSHKCSTCKQSTCKDCINKCCDKPMMTSLHRIVSNQLSSLMIQCICGCGKTYPLEDIASHLKQQISCDQAIAQCNMCGDVLKGDCQRHLQNCKGASNYICTLQECKLSFQNINTEVLEFGKCYRCKAAVESGSQPNQLKTYIKELALIQVSITDTIKQLVRLQNIKLQLKDQQLGLALLKCHLCDRETTKELVSSCSKCQSEQSICPSCINECQECSSLVCIACSKICTQCNRSVNCKDCSIKCGNCFLSICHPCLASSSRPQSNLCMACQLYQRDENACSLCFKIANPDSVLIDGNSDSVLVECCICEQRVLSVCTIQCNTCKMEVCVHQCIAFKNRRKCKMC